MLPGRVYLNHNGEPRKVEKRDRFTELRLVNCDIQSFTQERLLLVCAKNPAD